MGRETVLVSFPPKSVLCHDDILPFIADELTGIPLAGFIIWDERREKTCDLQLACFHSKLQAPVTCQPFQVPYRGHFPHSPAL